MESRYQLFFGLLRMAVSGTPYEVSTLGDEDWAALYRMAWQQSLTGVLYEAVSKLPTEQHPPMDLPMWHLECLPDEEAARLCRTTITS